MSVAKFGNSEKKKVKFGLAHISDVWLIKCVFGLILWWKIINNLFMTKVKQQIISYTFSWSNHHDFVGWNWFLYDI